MIDKDSGIPYYRQLIDIIHHQVATGVLKEGQQLPSEFELSAAYQVNRHTVRQAIAELCRCGVLYKMKGRGTFVAKPRLDCLEYTLTRKNRFTENILKLGHTPSSKVLRLAETGAADEIAQALGLSPAEPVYILELLRLVNKQPFLLSTSFIPARHLPGFLEKAHGFTSLFAIYEQHYGIAPERARSVFRASFPSQQEAQALDIPLNMPVLKAEHLLKSQDDILILYNVTCYRGDLAKVSVDWGNPHNH